ncbi:MAG: hypothetical protein NVSMB42_15900 [Herpetosiphon sp.]
MIEQITHDGQLLAILIPHNFSELGLHFVTPGDLPQQLAYHHYLPGKVINPHENCGSPRMVEKLTEVIMIKKGVLRVDLYSSQQEYVESRLLQAGDVILLVGGGHGYEGLEEVELIEVKQGPYRDDNEVRRFARQPGTALRIIEAAAGLQQ